MEFIQIAEVFQKLFQILANRRYFQMSVYHNVQNWYKPETHITQVDRNRAAIGITCLFRRELLWVLSMKR